MSRGRPHPEAALPEDLAAPARARARVRRHVSWARTGGLGRLIEEDDLDARERAGQAIARARWRSAHAVGGGQARAVLVVGVQRSGTNMLLRGLQAMPEVEVHGENDRALFVRFRLRSLERLRRTVADSRHRVVLVKPLCDSHDTDRLLAALSTPTGPQPRAVWAWRGVDARVRSAVAKFGDANQRVLARIAAQGVDGSWQAGRMSPLVLDTIRSIGPARLDAYSGAALFWWVRNGLYFGTGLDNRGDVLLLRYEDVLADSQGALGRVCAFAGVPFRPEVAAHVATRTPDRQRPLDLDPRVRALCDTLTERLIRAGSR